MYEFGLKTVCKVLKMKSQKSLLAKYSNEIRKAVIAHRDDEVEVDQMAGLPEGIDNGIARLTSCEFATYKKGKYQGETYFIAKASVISPEEHSGRKIKGLVTILMEPVCTTPNAKRVSTREHIAEIMAIVRRLGVDTTQHEDEGSIQEAVEALNLAKPYFSFRTWKGKPTDQYPNPRVNTIWGGAVEYTPQEEDVEDDTEKQEVEDDEEEDKKIVKKTTKSVKQQIDEDEDDIDSLTNEVDEEDEDEEEKDNTFMKGEIVEYKGIECEVVMVDNVKGICNLKNNDDGDTIYKKVPTKLLKKM